MEDSRQYLFDYLEEEFQNSPHIRVRIVPSSEDSGVTVRTESREYFFPFSWIEQRSFSDIEKLVSVIKKR